MIPKIIHYCWFGGKEKPKLVKDCYLSWEKNLADYEFKEWNETNADLSHPFVKMAYQLKKWAFVADYIRLKVLYDQGGIYLDTDMMLIKPLDKLLSNECFFGIEDQHFISAGIIGVIKKNEFIKKCLDNYDNIKIDASTDFNLIALPLVITATFRTHYKFQLPLDEYQNTSDIMLYPTCYFYPLPNKKKYDIANYQNYIEPLTFAVHLWSASWVEYNEFDYIKNKKYGKAFFKILYAVFFEQKNNLVYFKKVVRNILNSFKK